MYTPLGFGGGYALHPVHTRFVFQCPVYLITCHGTDDFLESARCAFAGTRYFQLPTFALAIFRIHAEKVSGKDSRFVPSGSPSDFEDGITVVLRVGRDEQKLDLFFQLRDACFTRGGFFTSHFLHLRIVFVHHFLSFLQSGKALHVFLACLHQVAQFLVFLGELHVAFLVGNNGRVGYQGRYFLEARNQSIELF